MEKIVNRPMIVKLLTVHDKQSIFEKAKYLKSYNHERKSFDKFLPYGMCLLYLSLNTFGQDFSNKESTRLKPTKKHGKQTKNYAKGCTR